MTFEQTSLVKAVDSVLAERGGSGGELRVSPPRRSVSSARWDENGSASALGQLTFFAEFLEVSALLERWATGCPLNYTSHNAPEIRDVLGTWLLSILDGQRR